MGRGQGFKVVLETVPVWVLGLMFAGFIGHVP